MVLKQKVQVEVDGMREPLNMMDAMRMKEAKLWVGAVKKEVAGLIALGCWEEVERAGRDDTGAREAVHALAKGHSSPGRGGRGAVR